MDEELNDLYDFERLPIDGCVAHSFSYRNESTGGNIITVELSEHQRELANYWLMKSKRLEGQKHDLIKSWLGI